MNDQEQNASAVLQALLTKQPNLFQGVSPSATNGRLVAEFMLAFIKTYAAGKAASTD